MGEMVKRFSESSDSRRRAVAIDTANGVSFDAVTRHSPFLWKADASSGPRLQANC